MKGKTSLVYFDNNSSPISITLDGYKRMQAILIETRACNMCGVVYTDENPNVSLNKCLVCFLAQHTTLRYIGLPEISSYGTTYKYLGENNYIYTSYTGTEDTTPTKSESDTIKYWGFPLPTTYTDKGEEKRLDSYYWSFYGDVVNNEVIVITWHSSYQAYATAFFAYKDGTLTEINRRTKEHRDLFKQAKEVAEATKDANGYYHVGEYANSTLYDSHLYIVISDLLTADYRANYIQRKRERVTELVNQWIAGALEDSILFEIVSLYKELGDTKNIARFQLLLETDPSPDENPLATQGTVTEDN